MKADNARQVSTGVFLSPLNSTRSQPLKGNRWKTLLIIVISRLIAGASLLQVHFSWMPECLPDPFHRINFALTATGVTAAWEFNCQRVNKSTGPSLILSQNEGEGVGGILWRKRGTCVCTRDDSISMLMGRHSFVWSFYRFGREIRNRTNEKQNPLLGIRT